MGIKILRDEVKDRSITRKAQAVVKELGLEMVTAEDFGTITPAEWKALVALPAMRRFIGSLAEGYVVAVEAEEVARVKHRNLRGARAETMNAIAQDVVVGKIRSEVYAHMLRGLAHQAAREV